MNKSIKQKAKEADGRRSCAGCKFYDIPNNLAMCSDSVQRICTEAYQKGYIKGYNDKTKEIKNEN